MTSTGTEEFYAWTWNDTTDGVWIKGTGSASSVVFSGPFKANIMFVRADPTCNGTPVINSTVWNQTEDLTTQVGGTYVTTGYGGDQNKFMLGNWQ